MNYHYLLMAVSLVTGSIHAATDEITSAETCNVVASDFDDVMTKSALREQIKGAMHILGFKDFMRCLGAAMISPQVRSAIYGAATKTLKDSEGKPVIGAAAYVEAIFKNLPFISEERRKQLIEVAWYVKPNVELIEFYQYLQNRNIPVYVWTNNDEEGYVKKSAALNAELKKLGKKPFEPAGVYWATAGTQKTAKHDPNYFRLAYAQIKDTEPLKTRKVFFIDDKKENVEVARKAAKEYALNLDAFMYRGKVSDLVALRAKFAV